MFDSRVGAGGKSPASYLCTTGWFMSGKQAKRLRTEQKATVELPKRRNSRFVPALLPFAFGVTLTAGVGLLLLYKDTARSQVLQTDPAAVQKAETLERLLSLPPEQLAKVDIAEMNLLCATGLPGSEDLDIGKCLAKLDRWAARVKHETERHLYRLTDPAYKEHAEHYKHSEARFRAEWLVAVLQQDIGLHYHAGFVPQDVEVPPFKTSKEAFLHGLMDNEDAHKAFGGNCVSLPVAYAAVGRRLGYPIKLVCAKEHVFCRWEGLDSPNPAWRERFNFDGAGKGFSIDPDEFYLSWPRKTFPDQVELCGWLKSLTPQEELSVFLSSRGGVLSHVNKDFDSALVAFAHSARLHPDSAQSIERTRSALEEMYKKIVESHPDAYRQMVARLDAKAGNAGRFDGLPPRAGGADSSASKPPWWKTEAGRAANMAEVQRINEENRRNMERMMPPQPVQPYRPPTPGMPQPYQPPVPGQPPR